MTFKIAMLGVLLIVSYADDAVARPHPNAPAQPGLWREAYGSSPVTADPVQFDAFAKQVNMPAPIADRIRPKHIAGTLRYRLTVSQGGAGVRIRLSNEEGGGPLPLTSVSVALAGASFDAVPGTLRPVTFGAQRGITIPAGAPVLSDAVNLSVPPGATLLVSIHPRDDIVMPASGGSAATLAPGDQTMADQVQGGAPLTARPMVSSIAVRAVAHTRVVATLGDSITDGNRSEVNALHGWPEQLAHRLAARRQGAHYAVVNAGISGNRLLERGAAPDMGRAGLARLDRDVLRIEGLSHILVLEGTNDIGLSGKTIFGDNPPVAAADIINGYRQIIQRAHDRNAKVVFGTLLPFGGSSSHSSPAKEALRQAVNSWIRTSGESDGIIDFDLAIRDPSDPTRMQARFDSGDHLHPNDAGYRAMGDAIKLSLFE